MLNQRIAIIVCDCIETNSYNYTIIFTFMSIIGDIMVFVPHLKLFLQVICDRWQMFWFIAEKFKIEQSWYSDQNLCCERYHHFFLISAKLWMGKNCYLVMHKCDDV